MLVLFSILLSGLLGFCGLALDVGRMELLTTQLQVAADAGALSAASEYQRGSSDWQAIAAVDATANETQNGITDASFAIQKGATSGSFSSDSLALQVTITKPLSLLFLGLVTGSTTTTVIVQAVALVPPCAFFTSTPGNATQNAGLYLASAGFSSPCPTYAASGYVVDGFGSLGYGQARSSGPSSASLMQGHVSPAAIYNTPVLPDPLAYVTAPIFESCTITNASISNSTATITPGTYCGGLTITNSTVTLQPGLYIVAGGVTISNSTVNGSGVTVYFTKGGGYNFGAVSIKNGSALRLNAPTTSGQRRHTRHCVFL